MEQWFFVIFNLSPPNLSGAEIDNGQLIRLLRISYFPSSCRIMSESPLVYCIARVKQVNLLTPMDRATLTHTKSTISHCTLSLITKKQASRAIFKAHCYTDRQPTMSVISTYIHGKAQTPFDRFVVHILYKQVATNTHKSNQWRLNLRVSCSVVAHRCEQQRFLVDGIVYLS